MAAIGIASTKSQTSWKPRDTLKRRGLALSSCPGCPGSPGYNLLTMLLENAAAALLHHRSPPVPRRCAGTRAPPAGEDPGVRCGRGGLYPAQGKRAERARTGSAGIQGNDRAGRLAFAPADQLTHRRG